MRVGANRSRAKTVAAGLLLTVIFGFSALFVWRMAEAPFWNPLASWTANHLLQGVPEGLGPLRPLHVSTRPDAVGSLLSMGMARESCGGALFEMGDEIAQRILSEGLDFFAAARHGRSPASSSDRHIDYSYDPWREMPLPADWFSEGAFSRGFACMSLDRNVRSTITTDARKPQGYYSRKQGGEIFVFPKRRLILLTFSD